MNQVDEIRNAVATAKAELAQELNDFQIVIFPEAIEFSYGGWLVPAEVRPSRVPRKSYELHRVIERLEDRLHDLTDSTMRIDLKPAA